MASVDISVVLTGVATALILYLIKVVLALDKKVSVLASEIEHLEFRIHQLEKRRKRDYESSDRA